MSNRKSPLRVITLIGIAAAFISLVATVVVCSNTAPFYFQVSITSSDEGTAQLYYDTGRGINPAEAPSARLPEGTSVVRLPLPPGEYRSFRFDPVDHGYCRLSLEHVEIRNLAGGIEREFTPAEFIAFNDMATRTIVDGRIDAFVSAAEADPSMSLVLGQPLRLRAPLLSYGWFALRTFLICFAATMSAIWLLCRSKWSLWRVLTGCALGLFVFLAAMSRFYAPINFDEGAFIWYGWLVNRGAVPYRDIFEPKGPVIFFTNAIGLSVFGIKNFMFRIVPTSIAVASIIVLYVALLKRRILFWLAALVAGQTALWLLGPDFHDTGLNDTETYGFAFTIIGLSLGIIGTADRPGVRRTLFQVSSGICFGLAVLSKELFVLSVVPAWLFLGLNQNVKRPDWRLLISSAVGVMLTAAAFLIYLWSQAAFGSYFEELRFSKSFAANYCVDIGRFPKVTGWSTIWQSWVMLHEQLYNLEHLAFLLAICGALLFCRWATKQKIGLRRLAVAIASIAFGMLAVSVGHCFWQHYFLLGTSGLLILMVLGAEQISSYLKGAHWPKNLLFGAVLVAALTFALWNPARTMAAASYSRRVAAWEPIVTETIEKHSADGDYVLCPGAPTIFVILNRQNPYSLGGPSDGIMPYLASLPPELQLDSLRRELEKNLPKVCYFPAWFRPNQQLWHEMLYDPLLQKYGYVQVDETLWYLPEKK